jgi:hypothetical protein
MEVFPITLILAAFLCSLVAGFLFAFAFVTMPGIKRLSDREFIQTFQAIDMGNEIWSNDPGALSVHDLLYGRLLMKDHDRRE